MAYNNLGNCSFAESETSFFVDDYSVLVKVLYCGICGTDILIYKNGKELFKGPFEPPVVLGHEVVGVIEEIGGKVSSYYIGDYVTANSIKYCGVCDPCKNKIFDSCENAEYLGLTKNGGFSNKVILHESQLIKINAEINDNKSDLIKYVFVEPLGCSFKALNVFQNKIKNKKVCIWGLGPIGYYIGVLSKIFGAASITGIDTNEDRVAIAMKSNYLNESVFDELSISNYTNDKNTVDYSFEASGDFDSTLSQMMESTKNKGIIVLVGRPHSNTMCNFNQLIDKQICIIGSRGHVEYSASINAINIIEKYPYLFSSHLYNIIPLVSIESGFEDLIKKKSRTLKTIVNCGD